MKRGSSARARVQGWFDTQGWTPFEFQARCWTAYGRGESGLILASTGIGKTYAAWFGPLIAWMKESSNSDVAPPLKVLWITPLRALATDIADTLRRPVEDMGLPWTIELRTGDTPASIKRRQRNHLPSCLVTTPESLSLMLSYPDARSRFDKLSAVIVDEWHELLGSKRGVLTELALSRLRSWTPSLRIWGLSATMGSLEIAMQALLGPLHSGGKLVHGPAVAPIHIRSVIPDNMERFPWTGHLGLRLLPEVVETIDKAGSTLVFTNTRSQTEAWHRAILEARPDWAGILALHHGSLDRRIRRNVEEMLREGRLKGVVCTSSLDLGVDFSPVDHVIQIGSPKGIARLLQRAGRSGHRPGRTSRITCVPTHAFELLEVAAARHAISKGIIEPRHPVSEPLDVLAQHMVSVALGGGFKAQPLYDEVRNTLAFHKLSRRKFDWVRRFVSTGGPSLGAYPHYHRLVRRRHRYIVENPTIARRHRMSIGTITGDAAITVRYTGGKRLGTIEERFVSGLKPGDVFLFAGRALEYRRIRDMTVWVRRSKQAHGRTPRWLGGRMPLSTQLAGAMRTLLDQARGNSDVSPEIDALEPILSLQAKWSKVPASEELLVEKVSTREGYHLFIYPFEGLLVNEGLAALLSYRLTIQQPLTVSIAANDYGFELLSDQPIPIQSATELNQLLSESKLAQDILASLNASEMARRQFRAIARIAGLVFQGFPGGRTKSSRQLQVSSSLLYNVFQRYDPQNLLLRQAADEVLDRQLDYRRLKNSLKHISKCRCTIIETDHPTPLAFPILVNRLRLKLSSERLAKRIQRLQVQLEKAAN